MNIDAFSWLPSVLAFTVSTTIAVLFFRFAIVKKTNNNRENSAILNSNTTPTSSTCFSDSVTGIYEVFLSFCGKDTRHGFPDFLYTYLVGASIHTFRDDNELRIGEDIGPNFIKAITESKISIPIFSKHYASQKWCLLELAHMVECQANGDHMIYPIFYDVDPSDVKNQRGDYEKAFRQHEKKFDEATVTTWREALRVVGQLKGLELKKETGGREGELVKIVVEKVLQELKKNYTHVPMNLVSMDNHIETLKGLLEVDFNGVRIVGIHGMGGLGKTTIAKVIYNELFRHFECHCFLDDIRENSHRYGIAYLQRILLSKIQNREVRSFHDIHEGSNRIRDTVHGKKVLIVLDDVDENSQIDKLIGSYKWFGARSRIIITTRNEGLLYTLDQVCRRERNFEVYRSYKPKLMDDVLSLKLFSMYAFMSDSPPKTYEILSKNIVSTAAGLPLVLVTLGSSLFGETDIELWDEKFRKLKNIPDKEVLEKLRLSFDPLDNGQKQIFLDISCFFVGKDKTNPCYMWDGCIFYPKEGLNILVRRSLITIEDDNTLRMHDQLRDLGRQIVCEGNMDELGRWSRLWCSDKALTMIKTRQGTEHVKALCLDCVDFRVRGIRTCLIAEEFHKLPNLRYLTLDDVGLEGDFEDLLLNLRWLQWKGFSVTSTTPKNFHLRNLVVLDLSCSYITNDCSLWSQIKISKMLKVLILSDSHWLSSIPNLSTFPNLERLFVDGCNLLISLHGIEKLEFLRYIKASQCKSLEILPNLSKLSMLEELDVLDCGKLFEVSGFNRLESLEVLNMGDCESIEALPCLSNLKKLKALNMLGCYKLVEIQGLDKMDSLENLCISNCRALARLPNLSNLKRLKTLKASFCCELVEIQGLDELDSLELLDISNCDSLERLPNLSGLKRLKKLDASICNKVTEIPGLNELESLEHLDISFNDCITKVSDDISMLKKLRELRAWSCESLTEIHGLGGLQSLENLDLYHCKSIKRLPNLSNLKQLKRLDVSVCEALVEIQGLDNLECLEYLNISHCTSIKKLPDLPNSKSLKEINLSSCYNLCEIEGLGVAESLESLDISFCDSLGEIIDLPNLNKLKKLVASFLTELNEIRGFEEMKSLEFLSISGCKSIRTLPDFSNLEKLKELDANSCLKLTELQGLEKLESLTKLSIWGCASLKNLPYLPNTTIQRDHTYRTEEPSNSSCWMNSDRNLGQKDIRLIRGEWQLKRY